jgi:hypothetical protein
MSTHGTPEKVTFGSSRREEEYQRPREPKNKAKDAGRVRIVKRLLGEELRQKEEAVMCMKLQQVGYFLMGYLVDIVVC